MITRMRKDQMRWLVGDRVTHAKWGAGIVMHTSCSSPERRNWLLTIKFVDTTIATLGWLDRELQLYVQVGDK
jgi:hypothetical protein